jgi:glycosyltransferase involved in cell wall biosynthesis
LLDHGIDGLTVDPRAPEQIEEALARMLSDDVLARGLAQRGRRKIIDRFSIDHLVNANLTFYRDCLESHAAGSRRQQERPLTRPDGSRSDTRAYVSGH